MNIAIFGLGYVGVVNMVCFSKLGHTVWGCDIKSQKVDSIMKGKSPIFEPGVDELLTEGLSKQTIKASTDVDTVLANTDLALICVGTPSTAEGEVNLDYTLNTSLDIVNYIQRSKRNYTVVYRSTIPPGTIEKLIAECYSELDVAIMPKVAFLPEFLREGSAIKDFFNCSRIVVGSNDENNDSMRELLSFDEKIPLVFTDFKTAEFVKYVDNAFHAIKIAFANEVYGLGTEYGVDVKKANEIFLMDTHLNIAPTYLRPGLPFGGSCLPKDLRAIQHLAAEKSYVMPVVSSIIPSNNQLLKKMKDEILALSPKKIALFGLTFKSGTDDVRESPMLRLFYELREVTDDIHIFDTDINLSSLRIEHATAVRYIATDAADAFEAADVIVVCKKGFDNYLEFVPQSSKILNFYQLTDFNVPNDQKKLYS
jgi:GDP-mannose 6-dehydrogenase